MRVHSRPRSIAHGERVLAVAEERVGAAEHDLDAPDPTTDRIRESHGAHASVSSMFAAVLLLTAQVAGAAWSGARPAECASRETQAAANVWERAKSPALRRYCDLLASGAAKLAAGTGLEEAREALAIGEEAATLLPDRAAPCVLRGRALARLGRWSEATEALHLAKTRDEHALDDPAALFAWGRALGRAGRAAEAEATFRALLPRTGSLPLRDRGAAELEAALLALARGPDGLDAAIAALREARRDAQDAMQAMAAMTLGLALDRADERDEARLALAAAAHADPRAVLSDGRVQSLLTDVGALQEADALAAILLESSDAEGARDAWSRYLAGPGGKGPWAAHARAHQMRRAGGAR